MPYKRQRRAAMQVMQNLGDGTSHERGPGKEILGQSSTHVRRQNSTATAQGGQRLPSNTQANCRNAGKVMAGSNAHTSLQMVRASGEVHQRPRECGGYHGIHRPTRCAVRLCPIR